MIDCNSQADGAGTRPVIHERGEEARRWRGRQRSDALEQEAVIAREGQAIGRTIQLSAQARAQRGQQRFAGRLYADEHIQPNQDLPPHGTSPALGAMCSRLQFLPRATHGIAMEVLVQRADRGVADLAKRRAQRWQVRSQLRNRAVILAPSLDAGEVQHQAVGRRTLALCRLIVPA